MTVRQAPSAFLCCPRRTCLPEAPPNRGHRVGSPRSLAPQRHARLARNNAVAPIGASFNDMSSIHESPRETLGHVKHVTIGRGQSVADELASSRMWLGPLGVPSADPDCAEVAVVLDLIAVERASNGLEPEVQRQSSHLLLVHSSGQLPSACAGSAGFALSIHSQEFPRNARKWVSKMAGSGDETDRWLRRGYWASLRFSGEFHTMASPVKGGYRPRSSRAAAAGACVRAVNAADELGSGGGFTGRRGAGAAMLPPKLAHRGPARDSEAEVATVSWTGRDRVGRSRRSASTLFRSSPALGLSSRTRHRGAALFEPQHLPRS